MSSTNKTSNLELSQFIGTDSPKWLTDYNSDMQKIDAGVAAVQTQADATDLVVAGHTSTIQANSQSITDQQTAITSLRADVTAAQGSINTINSLIGNGEPTTTNKTIIGAINEINAKIPEDDVTADDVSYDNQASGLAATNVQAAIDELKRVIAVQTLTGTATTNANGNLLINADLTDKIVGVVSVARTSDSGQLIGLLYGAPNAQQLHVCDYTAAMSAVAETEVTYTIEYFDIN